MNFPLFAVLYIAGMMFYDFTALSVPVNMCVNFCCSDRFVTQHTLYGAQVGASFKQVGGKGMAEGVRTDVFGDAGLLRQFLDEMEYHDARDIFAPACQEYIVLEVLLDFPASIAVHEPVPYLLDGTGRYGYKALFAALTFYLDEAFVEIQVGDFQVAQFRYP